VPPEWPPLEQVDLRERVAAVTDLPVHADQGHRRRLRGRAGGRARAQREELSLRASSTPSSAAAWCWTATCIGADARALGGALLPLYAQFAPDPEVFLKVQTGRRPGL
jgi:hypothetical protein